MNPRQEAFSLCCGLNRILLVVSILWLVGCAETGEIYTTQSIKAPDSFEIDKRLVGIWSSPLWAFFGVNFDIHFQHDEESDGMFIVRTFGGNPPLYYTIDNFPEVYSTMDTLLVVYENNYNLGTISDEIATNIDFH